MPSTDQLNRALRLQGCFHSAQILIEPDLHFLASAKGFTLVELAIRGPKRCRTSGYQVNADSRLQ